MSEIDQSTSNNFDEDHNEGNHLIETDRTNQNELDKDDNENYKIKTGNEDIDEMLNNLPEKEKKMIMKGTMSMLQMSSSNHIENPIAKKITEEHITKFLDASRQDMELGYKEKGRSKLFVGFIVFLAMIFIVTIIILLKNNPDVMEKIIGTLIGLVAGAIGGYGYGKNKNDD